MSEPKETEKESQFRAKSETASGLWKTIYHKTVYDFKSLKETITSAGFKNIHRYDWRQTIYKGYDDFFQAYIPHMDKERGMLINLNVESQK